MSIFDQTDQTNQATNTNQPTGSWLDRVVADKGETFRDPEELAKSLFNANLHIKTLETENASFKERTIQEDFGKQLLEQLRNQPPASGDHAKSGQPNTGGATESTPQPGPEDIKKLVEEAIANREYTRTREQNIAEADRLMQERFGDQAKAELQKRAQSLGVDAKTLADIAAKSPTAFLAMIGEPAPTQANRQPGNAVNTAALASSNSGKRDWKYYSNLKKSDPKTYRSGAVQMQMERDYAEQGDKFWG